MNCAANPGTTMWDVLSFNALRHLVLSAEHVTDDFVHRLLPRVDKHGKQTIACPMLSFLTVAFDDITIMDLEPLLANDHERTSSMSELATEHSWQLLSESRPNLNICIEVMFIRGLVNCL